MYASREQLIQTFGQSDVVRVSARSGDETGEIAVQNGLDYAKNYIDARLSVRFLLPLETIPDILIGIACDLAYERICSTADVLTDIITKRAAQAREDLKLISEGKMNLGLPTIDREAAQSAQPIFTSGKKIFGSSSRDL